MANKKQIPIRLDLDNEKEAIAYDYLQHLDKDVTYSMAVTTAILSLINNDNKQSGFEANSKPAVSLFSSSNNVSKDVNAVEIAKAVKDEISNALPELVAATLMKLLQMGGGAVNSAGLQPEKGKDEEPVPQLSEEAWNFLDSF